MTGCAATILAVDIGTSSLKAVVFAGDGASTGQITVDYETSSPFPGAREQETEDWWRAFSSVVTTLDLGSNLQAIVFTGTMQNCIAMDRDGRPIGQAILYSDTAVSQADRETCEASLPSDFARRVGNRPDSAMPVFRLMGDDARIARGLGVHYLFGAKDVLIERLTGRSVVDPTTATTTGLFQLEHRAWDSDLVEAAGLRADQLPEVLSGNAMVGPIRASVAAELGLPPGLRIINGAGDAGAATWGAGGSVTGRAHAYLGTTGWVASTMRFADVAPPRDTYTLAAPVGDAVIAIAPLLQAGSALEWVRGLSASRGGSDATIDKRPPAALFLPYLTGERSPFQDRSVRGAFLGLETCTEMGDLQYAALEGLCHAIRDNLDALGLRPHAMPLIGGVAENPLLRQLLADTLDMPVEVAPRSQMATAYGAFLFAASALGWSADLPSVPARAAPRSERRERAERRFRAYRHAQRAARDIAADLLAVPDEAPVVSLKEDHP